MMPSLSIAREELQKAGEMNPGPWVKHSENVAEAARLIAENCNDLNPERAYILGLLHDIGRRFGVSYLAHVYDGYHYLRGLGYDEAAKIALTHSFNLSKIEDYIGKFDVSEEKQEEIKGLLSATELDDYDYLIQLCDALALPDRIVPLEERMMDVKSRYGTYPQEKWDRNICLKEYFEGKMGRILYEVLRIEGAEI